LKFAQICAISFDERQQFERKIKKLGRKRGVAVAFDPGHGKGSHGRLYYGNRFTTLKDRRKEIGPGLLTAMLAQLGLSKADLED
jgi:mRNA interferase HicA